MKKIDDNQMGKGKMVGAAILGAVAGAVAVAMTSKDTQEKIHASGDALRSKVEEKFGDAKKKVATMRKEGKKKLEEITDKDK